MNPSTHADLDTPGNCGWSVRVHGAFAGRAKVRSKVELVAIPCTVVDAAGSRVNDLTREDFRIFDDDVPRKVSYFSHDDQPVTLGILIDESDSQHDLLNEHRRTALDLLHRVLRPGDSAFVISIGEDIRLYRDLTLTEMESLSEPCPKRQGMSVCGGSPLWEAVYDAVRLKLQEVRGTKALLLLTDEFDTGSAHSWKEAAAAAQKADTIVYAVQYRSEFGGSYAPQLLRLVAETAGTSFTVNSGDLGPVITRLEIDLRQRYVIGFRPEKLTFGKLRHEVRVEVTRPDLSVRARRNYFEDSRLEN